MRQKCYFNNEILSKLISEMFHELKFFENSSTVHKMVHVLNVKLHVESQMFYDKFCV